jgi:hypothetical protein
MERIRGMDAGAVASVLQARKSMIEKSGAWRLGLSAERINLLLWHCAFASPHDPLAFQTAQEIQDFFYGQTFTDENREPFRFLGLQSLLAELYVAKKMGQGVLDKKEEYVFQWLKICLDVKDSIWPSQLASGLMWMKAYDLELEVLRRTAAAGLLSDAQLQERLQFLESGGSNGPAMHSVEDAGEGVLQFDYASVSWQDEDYNKFFKNLAYENKTLEYALTVREWSKMLSFSAKLSGDVNDVLFEKIKKMLSEEYEDQVSFKKQDCVILAENASEDIRGILLSPSKDSLGFDHMAQFINMMKIGKNLSIEFYTLFLPTATSSDLQAKQAISLKKNLHRNISTYENAVRESVLRTIESFLNELQDQAGDAVEEPPQGEGWD